ncbi:hypothetical protein [Haliscomenobacter hydrossis]|uniref:Carbohydrate-binding CenC domain protein n=1 Tax=Haliscomenobacter hydrossis (strain ATCC 27775 / DSM 1100 / LMG 10767 / O) TaxID=760192 RepID=F4L873_HALH1|nr:hypothetical protein [Haliscomenobacter hydrossis]AEE54581.1 hypothetical protein Halhy_6768 [Haliscomenobacter hydrossis DSM 1100]
MKKYFLFITFLNLLHVVEGNSQSAKQLYIYRDDSQMFQYPWQPTLRIPNGDGIYFQSNWNSAPYQTSTCIRLGYKAEDAKQGFAGIHWISNPGINIYKSLGVTPGKGKLYLTFWAKGKDGGEILQYKFGGMGSIPFPTGGEKKLQKDLWEQIRLDISTEDLSDVSASVLFMISTLKNQGRPVIWAFIDEIMIEYSDK